MEVQPTSTLKIASIHDILLSTIPFGGRNTLENNDLNALRLLFREEVNAAVYASEQRLGESLGKRLDRIESDLSLVKTDFAGFKDDLLLMKKDIVILKRGLAEVEGNLSQVMSVLDEATVQINELQAAQRNLEIKVDESFLGLKREMQKLTYKVQVFMDNVNDAIAGVTMRIDMHKDTPLDQAHPNSAA